MADKAKIDGRFVSRPEINGTDTIFTVEGSSPWNSASKYTVYLNGPDSFYEYKTQTLPEDDAWSGGKVQQTITVRGNDPERLARYRKYILSLSKDNYWSFFKRLFNELPNILIKKSGGELNYIKFYK